MTTIDQTERLLGRMRSLSAADLSVLEAGLARPDVALTTPPGSANDLLWKALDALGWLEGSDDRFDMPNGNSFPLRKYVFTEAGRPQIADLFAKLRGVRAPRPPEVGARMAELYNGFCLEFLRQLGERVTEAGGERSDVEILLTNMMARFVKAGHNPDDAKRALEKHFAMARKIVGG